MSARVLAFAALVACGSAQDVPLPNTPPGFRVGTGPVVIEGFMDLLVRQAARCFAKCNANASTPRVCGSRVVAARALLHGCLLRRRLRRQQHAPDNRAHCSVCLLTHAPPPPRSALIARASGPPSSSCLRTTLRARRCGCVHGGGSGTHRTAWSSLRSYLCFSHRCRSFFTPTRYRITRSRFVQPTVRRSLSLSRATLARWLLRRSSSRTKSLSSGQI